MMKKYRWFAVCFAYSCVFLFYKMVFHRTQSELNRDPTVEATRTVLSFPMKENPTQISTTSEQEEEQENDEDGSFMEMMKRRMEERRNHVQETCRKLGLPHGAVKDNIRFLLSEKYKVAYCPVPKAGCSNMMRVMLGLNGYGNDTKDIFPKKARGQTYKLHMTVESKFIKQRRGFPEFVELQKYVRFLVVRHPLERALSSYKNKLTLQWDEKVPQFVPKATFIRRKYGTKEQRNANGMLPTFSEFVDYLYDANNTNINGQDNHWNSVGVVCHPCQNEFDVIAKLETIEEDLRYLLKLIGAPSSLGTPKGYSKSGKSKTNIAVDPIFKELSEDRLNKLHHVYKTDFEMFQYET